LRQGLALARAGEQRVGIEPLQLVGLRPAADQDLAAGQIEIEKGPDVLLHGDTADV
jgi:hypothetical protein